jgi:hypothetical protein
MDKNRIHYCPIGLVQRQFGIYVTGAGMEMTKPGEPYPHAYHSSDYYFTWRKGRTLAEWEYQILYIRSGEGEIEFTRGKRIAISAGSVIILHPGEWHRYRPDPKTGWSEAYMGIGEKAKAMKPLRAERIPRRKRTPGLKAQSRQRI